VPNRKANKANKAKSKSNPEQPTLALATRFAAVANY